MLSQGSHFAKRFTKTASAPPVELFVELKQKKMTSLVKWSPAKRSLNVTSHGLETRYIHKKYPACTRVLYPPRVYNVHPLKRCRQLLRAPTALCVRRQLASLAWAQCDHLSPDTHLTLTFLSPPSHVTFSIQQSTACMQNQIRFSRFSPILNSFSVLTTPFPANRSNQDIFPNF